MTSAQSAALVFSQSVAALAEIAGMHAANQRQEWQRLEPLYVIRHFHAVIDRYGISRDAVLRLFEEAGP
jgi:hypothetical protein